MEYKNITISNYLTFCSKANEEFDFFIANKETLGLSFVDWRISFLNLHEFIITNNAALNPNAMVDLFIQNFENSGTVMYERFEAEDRSKKVDKNTLYGNLVDYISTLWIDEEEIKKDDILFAEYNTQVDDPIFLSIPNADLVIERNNVNKHSEIHVIYPIVDQVRSQERREHVKQVAVEDFCFNDLFNYLDIKNNREFNLLLSLYNKIDNDKLIAIMKSPLMDSNILINEVLLISNGYLIFHHQLELILMHFLNCSFDEAILHRRNWNHKLVDQIKIWKDFRLDDGRTMYEVIISKSIYLIVNTSKTDPLAPAQCDPLTILFQNGVN